MACMLSAQGFSYHVSPVSMALFKGRNSGEEWQESLRDRENILLLCEPLTGLLKSESHAHLCACVSKSVLSTVTLCIVVKYVTCHSTRTNCSVKETCQVRINPRGSVVRTSPSN